VVGNVGSKVSVVITLGRTSVVARYIESGNDKDERKKHKTTSTGSRSKIRLQKEENIEYGKGNSSEVVRKEKQSR